MLPARLSLKHASAAALKVGGACWLALTLAAATAQAAWGEIKEGVDQKTALQQVGAPLIQNKARRGALETWTYDDGAYIFFENGKVRYWQAPRPKKP